MSDLNPHGHIKPTSDRFESYLDALRKQWVSEGVRPQKINGAFALLRELQRLRLVFSKPVDAAFRTKRISNETLAKKLGYQTSRQVQKYRQFLEEQGVIETRREKFGKFLNKWNSYVLTGFKSWFTRIFQQPSRKTGHPKEENNQRLLFQRSNGIEFPKGRLTTWDNSSRFWRLLAHEVTSSPPCLATLSDKFRVNLRKHQIPFNDTSIIARWKSFVRKSIEFQNAKRS